MNKLIALALSVLLFGCSAYGKKSSQWEEDEIFIGAPIEKYMAESLSVPESVTTLSDGRKIYVFREDWTYRDGSSGYCQFTFMTMAEGIILDFRWDGHCP